MVPSIRSVEQRVIWFSVGAIVYIHYLDSLQFPFALPVWIRWIPSPALRATAMVVSTALGAFGSYLIVRGVWTRWVRTEQESRLGGKEVPHWALKHIVTMGIVMSTIPVLEVAWVRHGPTQVWSLVSVPRALAGLVLTIVGVAVASTAILLQIKRPPRRTELTSIPVRND
jgi:hypothetical protein